VAQPSCPEWALVDFGAAALHEERDVDAMNAFERAKKLNPNNKATRYSLYRLYKASGEKARAAIEEQAFDRLSRADSDSSIAGKN
jgi:protein involved in temperature-dependent protein secretion